MSFKSPNPKKKCLFSDVRSNARGGRSPAPDWVVRSIERTNGRECRTESGVEPRAVWRVRVDTSRDDDRESKSNGFASVFVGSSNHDSLEENSSSDYASFVVDSTGKPGERRCSVRGASKSGDGGVVVIDGVAGGGGGRSSVVIFVVAINNEKRAKVQGVPLGPGRGGRPKVQDVRG